MTPIPGFVPAAATRRLICLALALLTLATGPALSADDQAYDPETVWRIPKIEGEMKVDGSLDEPAWAEAKSVRLTYETRPGENIAPPVETECLIAYDSSNLYVAFRAHDPEPAKIRARLTDRDTAWNDDFVGLVIDTFNDERRAFEFFVNPLGVQMDLFVDDVAGRETSSWDAIWASAGQIGETGYVVEMAIPFNQLRFPSTLTGQVWGVDALRFYPRDQRHRIATQPMDRNRDCYLCQVSKMEGFEGITPGRNLEVVPTLTGTRTGRRADFPNGEVEDADPDFSPGITARWGITPNITLSGTVNPDFSQVEADVAQLDVNTQFALFFPERRPFFLEGADFFDTPFDVVFTRNVADPDWGAKLTGTQGKNGFGIFASQDSLTNLIFPGSQGSRSGSFDFETLDSVLRYRRDFGQNSSVGLLVTSRDGDDYSNRVAGFDGLYRIDDKNSINFQVLDSETEYPVAVAQQFGQPVGSFGDQAIRIAYNRDARGLDIWGRFEDVGRGFRADMGFLPRVDYTLVLGGASYTWWGEEDDWYTQYRVGGDWDRTEDGAGNVLEEELEVWTEFAGPKQSWLWFDVGTRDRFFNGAVFSGQRFFNLWTEIQPSGDVWLGLFAGGGETIDFANTREADGLTLEPGIRYNFGLHLKANLDHTYQRLDVEGGELFTANLTQLRLVWQFDVRSFVRAIFQYRDIQRDPSLYSFEVEPESQNLFTQLLYSYKVNPQTVLFVGYSDNRLADQSISLTQTNRALFFKIGYAWVL
ncbi:MAG: DUF5916 domain-containing protein [Thermoanaerobaculia bacterium]|nr:DUF5916 domain-containing protein [Thermoanaerobaculia bacterium]